MRTSTSGAHSLKFFNMTKNVLREYQVSHIFLIIGSILNVSNMKNKMAAIEILDHVKSSKLRLNVTTDISINKRSFDA